MGTGLCAHSSVDPGLHPAPPKCPNPISMTKSESLCPFHTLPVFFTVSNPPQHSLSQEHTLSLYPVHVPPDFSACSVGSLTYIPILYSPAPPSAGNVEISELFHHGKIA